jgi:phosphohistidine swiveling domain-containing protein
MVELTGHKQLDWRAVGGKAYNLNRLLSFGLRVPPTVVLPISDATTPDSAEIADVIAWLDNTVGVRRAWPLAIRSSSITEDTSRESKAGHYLSVLGECDQDSLIAAITSVRSSGPRMAVVIQPLLDARFAGVLFSCDPLSYSRDETTIVWTDGLADRLVSGDEPGNQFRVRRDGGILSGEWPGAIEALGELLRGASIMEEQLGGPVDIEWVLDKDRSLWFVQSRAVVLPASREVQLDTEGDFAQLPAVIQQHSKIRLRRHAVKAGITMAPAMVECWSANDVGEPTSKAGRDFTTAAGVSVVLLHPERVDSKIIREFAPVRGCDVEFFAKTCRRYSIRRYPRTAGIASAKEVVLKAGLATCWISVAIVQAIWDAFVTGIIQRSKEGYVIELARGHFVPKGVVPTSTIILSRQWEVVSAVWRDQPKAYRFVDGHVLTEELRAQQMCLDDGTLRQIAEALDPLLDLYNNAALEFGIVENDDLRQIYLIDVAEADSGGLTLDADLITSGVLSAGSCCGRAVRVDLSAMGTLDTHLHDKPTNSRVESESMIVVAERASVDLLPYVGAPGVVGFIFERGSVLAHLAVVLREKGIPAVAVEDKSVFDNLPLDSIIKLDASQRGLNKAQRITIAEAHDAGSGLLVRES